MLTRRVRQRLFLLRPSRRTNRIVGYVVAVMQRKWNIYIHALCVMSNHWHICLTDPDGNIVEFQRDCHAFVARAVNAQHGDFESLWASQPTSRVECEEPEDLIEQIAYTMANPVESGLVRFGTSWPGVRRAWPSEPRTYARPKKFFRGEKDGGSWPDHAVLELVRPAGYEELSDEELAAVITSKITEREQLFRDKHDAEDRPFLSRSGVRAQSRYSKPASKETRFGISPQVACQDKWRRVERLAAKREWEDAYRDALERWRAGDREVVFPAGTYKMRVVHNVRCADPPT